MEVSEELTRLHVKSVVRGARVDVEEFEDVKGVAGQWNTCTGTHFSKSPLLKLTRNES